MRLQYLHPKLYSFLIYFIYSKGLMARLSDEVGKNHSVFDVAAGYGRMSKFIDPSNSYHGIDKNIFFINHGRRKGLDLVNEDIFNQGAYKKADIFLVIDLVHHLSKEKLKSLFDLVFQFAGEKVIIIEPAFVGLSYRYGIFGKFVDWFFKKIDDDGFNRIVRWFSDEEYAELFNNKFGSIAGKDFSMHKEKISNHHLVIFSR